MMEWMILPYKRYFDFSGRSRRMEYWMFALLNAIIVSVAVALLVSQIFAYREAVMLQQSDGPGGVFYLGVAILGIFVLGTFIPSLAVQVRRFHDQDKSGWFLLLNFVPYVGGLIVFVFMCLEGTRGPNRFGPDPKDPATAAEVFA